MSSKLYLIADFFYKDFTGGAELNDYSLISQFKKRDIEIEEVYCRDANLEFLERNKDSRFIIANFVSLAPDRVRYIIDNINYVIYEHDHKYLKTRNPIFYKNFIAPVEDLINYEFYEKANRIICLTQIALEVLTENTGLNNVSKIGASVWTDEDLDYISTLSQNEKNNKHAIMDSDNPIKKRKKCIQYCETMDIKYDLIKDKNHRNFLQKLSNYEGLVFMTGHLETCCRLVVEAKMLGCKTVIQKKLIGAASEDWFELTGDELIKKIREISNNSVDVFLKSFEE